VRWSYSPYSPLGGGLIIFCPPIYSCWTWSSLRGASLGWTLTERGGSSGGWYTNSFLRLYSAMGADVFLGSYGDY